MFLAAILELAGATTLFFWCGESTKLYLIAWLSSVLAAYRFGLWLIDFRGPCACLGSTIDWLQLNPRIADAIAKILLWYMLIFSYGFLSCRWLQTRLMRVR